jgi:anaphase-promoting complex subunit 6
MIKQSRYEDALALLGEHNPTQLIASNSKRKHIRGTHRGATANANSKASSRQEQGQQMSDEEAATRRYEAAMCYLRGLCYAKQNAFDRAKECYKVAVHIDVQCFEAFTELTRNSLMSPDEEQELMISLDFSSFRSTDDDADVDEEPASYIQMLYTTQLSKYRKPDAFNTAMESLTTHYGLEDNADILLARADLFYTQCRFRDALTITNSILSEDKFNFSVYPLHLACLYELKMKNTLFLIAHELADNHLEQPCTYLAIGIYYFSIDKIAEARRYFSKASMMDANFGPAWIGFAHTFAAEGEHDQAISAYSTAARLFMGTHLPQVFLGMQNHAMNNMTTAEEFLRTAYGLCKTDPLLLNEMGVVYYHQDKLDDAIMAFKHALKVAEEIDSDPQAWLGTHTNLGHAYRRQGRWDEALQEFDTVLRDGGKDATVFCAKGLIHLDQHEPDKAIKVLHEALAVHPQDPIATELLNKALDESMNFGLGPDTGELAGFEAELNQRKVVAKTRLKEKVQGKGTSTKGKGKAVMKSPLNRRGYRHQLGVDESGEGMDMIDDDA